MLWPKDHEEVSKLNPAFLKVGWRIWGMPSQDALEGHSWESVNQHAIESVRVAQQWCKMLLNEVFKVLSYQTTLQILIQFFENETEQIDITFGRHLFLSKKWNLQALNLFLECQYSLEKLSKQQFIIIAFLFETKDNFTQGFLIARWILAIEYAVRWDLATHHS